MFNMTLQASTSNPLSKQGDAMWERDSPLATQSLETSSTCDNLGLNPKPVDLSQATASSIDGSKEDSRIQDLFKELIHLDYSMDQRSRCIHQELANLPSSDIEHTPVTFLKTRKVLEFLRTEEEWFSEIQGRLCATRTLGDEPIRVLRDAMVKRGEEIVKMTGEKRREFKDYAERFAKSEDFVDTST
jgi:hypothetical protein